MDKKNFNTNKNSGFTAPEDYFKNFEESIMSHAKLKNNVQDPGFTTPENYFDSLEDTILNKVSEQRNVKVIPLFSKWNILYISGAAAAVLLFFNIFVFENDITFDSLDTETVENYIINEGLNSYEIASLLDEDDLSYEDFIEIDYTNETIESYILDHLDIEDLIIE